MATIDIDVGKRQLRGDPVRGEGGSRKAVLRFGADPRGLADLRAWLAGRGEIPRAVLESSGHNHVNLAAAQRAGPPVAVINPRARFTRRPLEVTGVGTSSLG